MKNQNQSFFFEKLIGFIVIGMISFCIALFAAGYVIINYMIPPSTHPETAATVNSN